MTGKELVLISYFSCGCFENVIEEMVMLETDPDSEYLMGMFDDDSTLNL